MLVQRLTMPLKSAVPINIISLLVHGITIPMYHLPLWSLLLVTFAKLFDHHQQRQYFPVCLFSNASCNNSSWPL